MGILIFKSKTVSETHPREASIFSTNVTLVFLYEHAFKEGSRILTNSSGIAFAPEVFTNLALFFTRCLAG